MDINSEEDSKKPIITPEEFDKMVPRKKNPIIIAMVQEEIKKQGLEGKLTFKPLESLGKPNRKKYYTKAGRSVFEEYMSQLNTMPMNFLEVEVKEIVANSKKHFKLV